MLSFGCSPISCVVLSLVLNGLDADKVFCLASDVGDLSIFRWSIMTYEVPTSNKSTPIVKEDDSHDFPLQVN